MRVSRLLAVPVLLIFSAAAPAQTLARQASRVLDLVPGQAQTVEYYPEFRRLEAKWSKVAGQFGGKDSFLRVKQQTGIDPARLGTGPIARVSFRTSGPGESWAWLVPAKDPKTVLQGLRPTQKGGVWTWEGPAGGSKKLKMAPAPAPLFGTARGGYLVVTDSETTLAAFKKPATTLAAELAPYAAWMEGHDLSLVATKSAVEEAARSANESFQRKPAEEKAGAKPEATPSRAATRLQAKFAHWADLARTSVHHVLGGLDLSEDGGVAIVAQALLIKGSPLSQELQTLLPVAGHPMKGLAAPDFALAFGGEWGLLSEFQAAVFEDLDKTGKVQPATSARLQKALEAQNTLTRSLALTFSAPAPRGSLMSGLTCLIRASDSQAYLTAMEATSQAQNTFLQELGMPGAVSFTRDTLPGVPSCTVITRLDQKQEDPATASSRMAMAMIFGGDAIQMSLGALDDHRVVAVMGGSDLLKARMEEARKSPEGLAPSIAAVEPDLGRDHRFAFYLDPRGIRNVAQVLAGMFGRSEGAALPAIPEVPAAGLTLSLDPTVLELRGSVRAETLKATATLIKALGAMVPANRKGDQNL